MILVEFLPTITPAPESIADRLVLTWEERAKTRQRVCSEAGREVAVKLPTGTRLFPGTVVALGEGFHVEVAAADEDVWVLRPQDSQTLARLAWEIGNRHFPIEIGEHAIAVRYDHTLTELWERMGVPAERIRRPFLSDQHPTHHHD